MGEREAVIRPHGRRRMGTAPVEKPERRYDYRQLAEWQGWGLDAKIGWARERIEVALKELRRPCVAFSAGKDSTVLLHLLRQYDPQVLVMYGNTGIEFPECVRFARWLREVWHLNYYEARPEVTFWWVVENYGWPLLGKTFGVGGVAHKESRARFFRELETRGELVGEYAIQAEVPISSACCTFLKERPSQKLQKALGVDGVFLGIMASESRRRRFNFLQYGEWYRPQDGTWRCHPLAIWTDEDVWAYIGRYEVPYAPLYDMGYVDEVTGERVCHKRNGCMFCGMDLRFPRNHLSIMRRTHPKAWRVLMVKKGLGEVLLRLRYELDDRQGDLFAERWNVEEYVEQVPCVFDRVV